MFYFLSKLLIFWFKFMYKETNSWFKGFINFPALIFNWLSEAVRQYC